MFKLFSVDDHIVEPPGVWTDRVPACPAGAGAPCPRGGWTPDLDHIVCDSDYPHADTPVSSTQAACRELFEGIPQEEIDMITHQNAEALFGFKISA